jgi:type IV pilus assembly protein PilO
VLHIDIDPEAPQDLYVKIPVKMEIRGTYHQVAKFFKNTSELRRIVNVENLSLTPERATATDPLNATPRVHAKFVAATFRFKETSADGAAVKP